MDTKYRDKSAHASSAGVGVRYPKDTSHRRGAWMPLIVTGLVIVGLSALVVWFFHFDSGNTLSRMIQHTGTLGVVIAIVTMAVLSVVPVPTEFVMILVMKVYGPWWGVLYSWIGTMTTALVTFTLARHFGRQLLQRFISDKKMKKVSRWIGERGVVGLLLARIVPVPFIVVNYTAGISKEVRFRDYVWTTAVGGIPYYVGSALVFMGASRKYMTWIVVGGIAVLSVWVGGYLYNRHLDRTKAAS